MSSSLRSCARLAGATLLALLAGCGGNGENVDEPVNAGFVRLVNATPTALSLYDINTASTIASVGANAGSAYVDRLPESHDFTLFDPTGAQVGSLTTGVARQERYTLVAARSGNGYSVQLLTDNESSPSSGAKLRVYNAAATDLGNLDVYLAGSGCTSLVGPAFDNVSALTGYKVVGAGSAFHVCVTTQGDPSDVRLDIPGVAFGNAQVVTLVLARGRGGALVDGMLVVQRGTVTGATNTSARIRLVADITAGTTVVASANGVSLGSGSLTSPAVGGYALVPAGTVNIGATLGSTDTTLVADVPAAGGGDYTLLLTGTAAVATARLITDDNTPSASTANPVKLRLVNGLNGLAGSASFSYESSFAASAAFGTASATVLRPVTTGAPALEASFGAAPLTVPTTGALTARKVYTLFLLGTPGAPVAKLQQDR